MGEKVRHIRLGERFIHPNLRPAVGNGYTKIYGGMAQFGLVCDQQAMVEDGVCGETEVPFSKARPLFPKDQLYRWSHAAVAMRMSQRGEEFWRKVWR